MPGVVLNDERIVEGCGKCIVTSKRLLLAAYRLGTDYIEIGLGLAAIGQEELGKSLTLLAALHLGSQRARDEWVWSGWRNHRLKAHRAFLYELIHPRRIELEDVDGSVLTGAPIRKSITHEKEASLYVDVDANHGRFVSPQEGVDPPEALNRTFALYNLSTTASQVWKALVESDLAFRFATFSEIAYRICTENLHQQDMPDLLSEFERRSPRHRTLLDRLRVCLAEGDQLADQMIDGELPSTEDRASGTIEGAREGAVQGEWPDSTIREIEE